MISTTNKVDQRTPSRLILSTRFTLAIGFGGLLAIMAFAGIDALWVLKQIRSNDEQIRRQFLFRNHVLNNIRADLYVSGTYVRDYLLEPDPVRAETFRANLKEVRKDMESAVASYAGQLDATEVNEYAALNEQLSYYWKIIDPTLQWNPEERRRKGYPFLRDELFPRRTATLEVAGQIAGIDEQQLNAGTNRVLAVLSTFQTRVALTLVATLALGLAMAAYCVMKILRLETRAHEQYRDVAEARSQLKELSSRLVLAQEAERRTLSRELHDEVGQALSAVLVELRNLSAELVSGSRERAHSHVEMMKELVEGTVRVVRNMALLLRPSMLDDLGLIPALQWQAREVSKRTSMNVSVATDLASDDLPEAYKTCLYRVVQEALHNCSRHSHATTVCIRIEEKDSRLSLSIQDDGQGFNAKESKGLGLLGIEERVAHLGGKCEVHSEAGAGTILAIELPLNNREGKTNTRGWGIEVT